jgi:uncharacterized protein (TIGR03437 family)
MIYRFVFSLIALLPFAAAQVQLQFGPGLTNSRVLQLPNGDQLLVGTNQANSASGLSVCCSSHAQIALAALGGAPFRGGPGPLASLGGSGNDEPQAAAVDPSGNVWIVGNTDSDDFDLVNPIVAQKVPYRTAGFVIELDPTGSKLLFATYLAGKLSSPLYHATKTTAIALDSSGNAYVGGTTNETDFPTTPGAYMGGQKGADSFFNTYFYSYLVKISPAGKLLYGTLLETGSANCMGSECIGYASTYASVSAIVPVSGSAAAVADARGPGGGGSVIEVAADGSKLLWDDQLSISFGVVGGLSMVQDGSGNLDLFGGYTTGGLELPGSSERTGPSGLFVAQLKPDGSALNYATDLGESADVNAAGLLLDASGNEYLAGSSSSPQFPTLAGVPNLGSDFVLQLGPSGTGVQKLFRFPHGTIATPPAFSGSGSLLLLGAQGALLTLPPSYAFDSPAIVGFANSASYALNPGFYPGALITLYGFDLPASTAGLQVLFDGTPAALLYAGPDQINLQVPFEVPTGVGSAAPITLQVVTPSGNPSIQLGIAQSLGIFTTDRSHAAALNQDGTVNSASNPASAGSIVSLFGTGATWPAGSQDGAAPTSATPWDPSLNKFEMVDGDAIPLNILYAGNAPGLIDGVFQIDVQLPPTILPAPSGYGLTLHASPPNVVGQLSANVVIVYTK